MLKALTRLLRGDPAPSAQEETLRKRVQRLEIALGELHDDLVALEGRHSTLAKRSYGRSGGRPRSSADDASVDDAHLTKAQLRQRLGIIPGRQFHLPTEDSKHGH